MGSGAEVCIESALFMNSQKGKKWGVLKMLLYRPWPADYLLKKIPASCKRICVLDKTREEGASAMPVYLDVLNTLTCAGKEIKLIGGVYGLASKNFTPDQVIAIYENLEK